MPEPNSLWQPVSYAHEAVRVYREAYELSQLAFRIDQMCYIVPPGMPKEKWEQRAVILRIAVQLIALERDKAMDRAMKMWSTYRSMRPSQETPE